MGGDLRQRFGWLVKAHRRRLGLTQETLAEQAGISVDMISKIEAGSTGASFRVIESLALALSVDPAELFTPELPKDHVRRSDLVHVVARLTTLTPNELSWISGVMDAALRPRD